LRNENAERRTKLTYRAYAKINLLLDVTGKLPNGYHSVAMINQSIDLHDTVTVERTPGTDIEIACDRKGIPFDKRNIVWKACEAFGLYSGVSAKLEKRIPSEAGLAGGSADAAAVLVALRAMFRPEMTSEALCGIAARVGADVPFCLTGGCCLAEGIGEVLTPLPCLPEDYSIALVKPEACVSTGKAYERLDAIKLLHPRTGEAAGLAKRGSWEELFSLCGNVFEQAAEIPGLQACKRQAGESGALLAQMTGSGSAVFAVYHKRTQPGEILRALGRLGEDVRVCKSVPFGVELIQEESI